MKRWRCVDCKTVIKSARQPLRCRCRCTTFAELPPQTVEEQIAESRDLGQLKQWGEAIRARVGELREEFEATEQEAHGQA